MRKLLLAAMTILTVSIVMSCKPSATNKNSDGSDSTSSEQQAQEQTPDSTIYGTFVDGGHAGFMLKCEDDSVREFVIDIDNDSNVVLGGMAAGDQMAVISQTNGLGEHVATKVINLTTLQATWTSLDKNFEIEKGGGVQSHQQDETQPWTQWRIFNGHLVLNKDTFDIDRLDGDSLFLENSKGIFAYSRAK